MIDVDVAIVGGGIAGASAGYFLAGQRSVLLLEREAQPGYHSTGRSAAMFMESYGPPMVRALTRASRPFYESPPPGFVDHPLLAPRGALYVATHEHAPLLEKTLAELLSTGSAVERLDAAATLRKLPSLREDLVAGALYEAAAQDIDASGLHQAFLRGLRSAGAKVQTSAAIQQGRWTGEAWTLRLSDGSEARARVLVNAAGAWADEVAQACGIAPVGLTPCRRSAFTFKPQEGMDTHGWPAVIGIDESWYFKPDAGQLLGSPANADPVAPHDVVPEEIDIATGIYQIESVTTLTIRRPTATWAGLRSFVSDGELVIGAEPSCPSFFWVAAQGGYGIQSAAGAGQLAAALVSGHALPAGLASEGVDPALLSPKRFR